MNLTTYERQWLKENNLKDRTLEERKILSKWTYRWVSWVQAQDIERRAKEWIYNK